MYKFLFFTTSADNQIIILDCIKVNDSIKKQIIPARSIFNTEYAFQLDIHWNIILDCLCINYSKKCYWLKRAI